MKTIGLIGGMSYESTITYYNLINQTVLEKLGGHHSAKILMYSVDFEDMHSRMVKKDWDGITIILTDAAKRLEDGGADFILICTNTMHCVFDRVQAEIGVPMLHIADAVIEELLNNNIRKVILLGTMVTMQQNFYTDKLLEAGISVLLPTEDQMKYLDRIIFDELCIGNLKDSSKQEMISIISELSEQGAKACIFGCTEIGLLISCSDIDMPIFDSAVIHSLKAANVAILD